MPKITSVKQQKDKNRVNIYLDGEFGFGIDLDNFVRLNLKVEQELTEKEISQIVQKAEFRKALNKLLTFATLRPRSQKEVRDWFKRKEINESLHKRLFNRLKHLQLLDDLKFAQWWIEQRMTSRPKSKRLLSLELLKKGISRDLIEQIIDQAGLDEAKTARNILTKKLYRWKSLDGTQARKKASEYLLRAGFNWEIIRKVVDEVFKK